MGKKCHALVTGGAGYIGGQTVLSLLEHGHQVSVLDDLSTGRLLPFHESTSFFEGRVQDGALVRNILSDQKIDAIFHFAGSIKVDESITNPLKYYENNTEGSRVLIDAAVACHVPHFIFSSTAAVYGETGAEPVRENASTQPLNPYGWSKLFTERQLLDVAATGVLNYGIFRYFNVAGADPEMRHGQYLERPVHLIGRAIDALLGKAPPLSVFGDGLPTPDGTGVRDYIHVCDVADAHVALLQHLLDGGDSKLMNLGYGRGASVLDIINRLSDIAGKQVPYEIGSAREGEAPSVVADVSLLSTSLDWQARYNRLDQILRTALAWQQTVKL